MCVNIQILIFFVLSLLTQVRKLHDHDEYINAQIYLDGIKIYTSLILNLAFVWIISFPQRNQTFF